MEDQPAQTLPIHSLLPLCSPLVSRTFIWRPGRCRKSALVAAPSTLVISFSGGAGKYSPSLKYTLAGRFPYAGTNQPSLSVLRDLVQTSRSVVFTRTRLA